MRHYGCDLFVRKHAQETRRCCNRSVAGIASGRKGVRMRAIDNIDFWNRQTGPDRELTNHSIEFRGAGGVHFASPVHGQYDFAAIPKLNKMQVLELARCEWIIRRENVIALGPSGTGKTHVAIGLGLAACQKGLTVGFTTASALVSEMMEVRDERRLLRLQKQMAGYKLLIIDELGFVPLSKTGAELLFELISQRYERGSTLITSNLPFDEWTETFGSERLTGALLDRLTHHVSILEMNGESYRLAQSQARQARPNP